MEASDDNPGRDDGALDLIRGHSCRREVGMLEARKTSQGPGSLVGQDGRLDEKGPATEKSSEPACEPATDACSLVSMRHS